MKVKIMCVLALAILLSLVFASVALAVSQATIDAIIADVADNGRIDGTWTVAEIQATLNFIKNNPLYQQYADYAGVLQRYLASIQPPGTTPGPVIHFTGSELLLVLGAGIGLVGSGALLRRRRA
jgi:ABC-type dipeptide/oligopeptide/nickel transport system permease component